MAKDILQEIVAYKRIEVAEMKKTLPMCDLEQQVSQIISAESVAPPSMRQALLDSESGIIAEFKRRSPSKGWINQSAEAAVVPISYEKAGASAVSILTDKRYFGGEDAFVAEARQLGLKLPVLYKNFVIDEYQLLLARRCGASAVLLIAAELTKTECGDLLRKAHGLGLEVLLEMHDEHETEYAALEPDMCGINNRHLGTFVTDVNTSFQLSQLLPDNTCKVSESGISNPETVCQLREMGFRGFLIGEHFMRTTNPGHALADFIRNMQSSQISHSIHSSHNPHQ